ncbi:MAG: hypothetical protein RAO75_07390 [Candidatus Chlorobium antarcticum]|jgi:hypothetical protein|nr:hypothetical protein [Candidatus Chlorobium antarcticum]
MLSEGRLFGLSADLQAAFADNLVGKGSFGYEELEFPFSDDTKETNETFYTNIGISWEPFQSVTVGADWKGGASENCYSMTLSSGHWILNGWYSEGQNGIEDDKGVMLSYSLAIPYGGKKAPLAERMRPSRSENPGELLAEVQSRPLQLPTEFLAKVDLTAVTEEASISRDGLTDDITVDKVGDIYLTVGNGAPTIDSVTRNGITYTSGGVIERIGTQVVIRTLKLPEGIADWKVEVTDGISTVYAVTFETE